MNPQISKLILEGLLAASGIPGFAVRIGWRDDVILEIASLEQVIEHDQELSGEA